MSFDFFNTSHLAFGLKLTQAFAQLDRMMDASKEKLEQLDRYAEVYNIYNARNYPVPVPTNEADPCRTNEIFDIFNDQKLWIGHTQYYNDNTFKVYLLMYDRNTNIMTRAEGSTTLRKGNTSEDKTIQFVENEGDGRGVKLFKFRIDSRNNTNISEINADYNISKGDETIFSSIAKGPNVSFPYTAEDYECLCVVGKENDLLVTLNGKEIARGEGKFARRHQIVYVKPGDVVSGHMDWTFKVYYGKDGTGATSPEPPTPEEPEESTEI